MNNNLAYVLQVIVALGLLNVWLLRYSKSTNYRGGEAKNLKEEFKVYGLSESMFYLVGFLKISSALLLLLGLWLPAASLIGSAIIVVLMLGAVAMHIKVGDSPTKAAPASLMLLMSGYVAVFYGLTTNVLG